MVWIATSICSALLVLAHAVLADVVVESAAELVETVRDQPPETTITIRPRTYE